MIAAEVEILPGRGTHEARIYKDGWLLIRDTLVAVRLESLVGLEPNTGAVKNFTGPSVRTATGTVPLSLGALVLGTEVSDLRQRTVATIMASIEHKLRGVLKGMETFFKELLAVDQLVKPLHEMIEG